MAAFVLVLQVLLFGTMLKDRSFVETETQSLRIICLSLFMNRYKPEHFHDLSLECCGYLLLLSTMSMKWI